MQKFPRDRFDSIPHGMDRVGAHRAPERRGRRWVAVAWAALATVVLAGAGIAAVAAYNQRLDFDDALPSAAAPEPGPTAEPTVAPDVTVAVLNGTTTSGLAASVGELLSGAGVSVGVTSNADASDIEQTVVYYGSADLEGAARGVLQQLPVGDVRLSEEFGQEGMQIVVVLGSDYPAPGAG
ncbi:LytR C-terminal domain-containing protein [Agromyces sp. SYSU T0242]|uniref:LytR C-terminal domain-containing protein n=1 Tax=Agromyces litoreus TaxID=3158561 RepID=UPI00339AC9F9